MGGVRFVVVRVASSKAILQRRTMAFDHDIPIRELSRQVPWICRYYKMEEQHQGHPV
jgi:hypothetical protein